MTEHEHLMATTRKWEHRLGVWWKTLIVVGFLAVMVTAVFVVVTLVEVQQLSESNNRVNKKTLEISTRIIDCTTPGHGCYDDSQKRAGEVVYDLNAVTKAAVICADRPGTITEPEMEICINEQLKRK